jgi:hypothetical protein
MNITLNIDEKLFDEGGIGEAIKEAFLSMPIEEKSVIMKDILKQYLLDSEFVKKYFIEKRSEGYSSYSRFVDYPTTNFIKLINTIDFKDEMEDVKKVFIDVIENNLRKEVLKLMVDSYVNTMANTLFKSSSDFKDELSMKMFDFFNQEMIRRNNQG